jgi:hypothetical protein
MPEGRLDAGTAILWLVAFGAAAVTTAVLLVVMLAAALYWPLAILFGLIGWAVSDLPGALAGVFLAGAIRIIVWAQTH